VDRGGDEREIYLPLSVSPALQALLHPARVSMVARECVEVAGLAASVARQVQPGDEEIRQAERRIGTPVDCLRQRGNRRHRPRLDLLVENVAVVLDDDAHVVNLVSSRSHLVAPLPDSLTQLPRGLSQIPRPATPRRRKDEPTRPITSRVINLLPPITRR